MVVDKKVLDDSVIICQKCNVAAFEAVFAASVFKVTAVMVDSTTLEAVINLVVKTNDIYILCKYFFMVTVDAIGNWQCFTTEERNDIEGCHFESING